MDNDLASARLSWDAAWRGTAGAWFESEGFLDAVLARFEAAGPLAGPILDVGCGRGALLARLRREVTPAAFGLDFALDSLRKGGPDCLQANASALPVVDGACGSVVAVLLVEHLPDYQRFLAEAWRVLRPGGRIYLVFPNRYSLVTPVLWFRRVLRGRREVPWHRPLAAGEAAAALAAAGFTPAEPAFLSIGTYRGGLDRLASTLIGCLALRLREEIVLTGGKL